MIKKLNNIVKNLLGSFNNQPNNGYSGRKLSALFAILMGAYITKYELPAESQLHALYAWLIVAMVCLGIVTVEQIIRFKNGSTTTVTETKVEAEQTTTETKSV